MTGWHELRGDGNGGLGPCGANLGPCSCPRLPIPEPGVQRTAMSDTKKEIDQDKGDEVLKRMLKTPPKPLGKDKKAKKDDSKTIQKS